MAAAPLTLHSSILSFRARTNSEIRHAALTTRRRASVSRASERPADATFGPCSLRLRRPLRRRPTHASLCRGDHRPLQSSFRKRPNASGPRASGFADTRARATISRIGPVPMYRSPPRPEGVAARAGPVAVGIERLRSPGPRGPGHPLVANAIARTRIEARTKAIARLACAGGRHSAEASGATSAPRRRSPPSVIDPPDASVMLALTSPRAARSFGARWMRSRARGRCR